MRFAPAAALALLGLSFACAAAVAAEAPPPATGGAGKVEDLGVANFTAIVAGADKPFLVEFVAPWCGHCKVLGPRFEAVAKELSPATARFGKVNCVEEEALATRFGVNGYPTVLLVPAGTPAEQLTKEFVADTMDATKPEADLPLRRYMGARTAEGIASFVHRMRGPAVLPVAVEDVTGATGKTPLRRLVNGLRAWAGRTAGPNRAAYVLVTPRPAGEAPLPGLEPVYAALAGRLQDSLVMGALHFDPYAAAATAPGSKSVEAALLEVGAAIGVDATTAPMVLRVETDETGAKRLDVAAVTAKAPTQEAAAALPIVLGVTELAPAAHLSTEEVLLPALHAWVQRLRFPSVVAISPDVFPAMASNPAGAYLAIAVIHEREAFGEGAVTAGGAPTASKAFLEGVTRLAGGGAVPGAPPALPPAVRDRFIFGWLDATLYGPGFLHQFNISPGDAPQLLVIDPPSKSYWHDASVKEQTDMETYLADVASGMAPVQRQGVMAVPQAVVNRFGLWPTVAAATVIAAAVGWLVWRFVLVELCDCCGTSAGGKKVAEAAAAAAALAAAATEAKKAD